MKHEQIWAGAQGTYLLLMHEFINSDFYFSGRMDHLWQTLIFTMVSEVGIVSSAQIWLKSHLWFESGLRWDANLTSEGRGLPCFTSILWPVSAAAFHSENRVMVQPATNCSVTPFIDSTLGCCFDQIPQTTKSHPVVGSGSEFVPMNWSFWAFISVSESKYSQHINSSAKFS